MRSKYSYMLSFIIIQTTYCSEVISKSFFLCFFWRMQGGRFGRGVFQCQWPNYLYWSSFCQMDKHNNSLVIAIHYNRMQCGIGNWVFQICFQFSLWSLTVTYTFRQLKNWDKLLFFETLKLKVPHKFQIAA